MGFAIKVSMDIDRIVDQLPLKDKIELVRRLGRETRRRRWSGLLARLRKRANKRQISANDILTAAHQARRQMHA